MDWRERRIRFREHLQGNKCIRPASVFDPISARIAEDLGYEVGMFAGSVASLTVLGAPDLTVLTLYEFSEQTYRICRAGNLPILVDADHGYGNALNVRRTVEELETSGVCAMTIEDTDLPLTHGDSGAQRLVSIEEGKGKLEAALDARQDSRLVIVARTSAVNITNIEDAIKRAMAYEAVGVDAMFFTGIQTRKQIKEISEAIKIPIMLGNTPEKISDFDFLAKHRVRVALQGHIPFNAAVKSVYEVLKSLREGISPTDLSDTYSKELISRVTRSDKYNHWIEEYLA